MMSRSNGVTDTAEHGFDLSRASLHDKEKKGHKGHQSMSEFLKRQTESRGIKRHPGAHHHELGS